jgi:hypothetical protein
VSSCGKYEEGSNFTFLTAKARIVNTWTLSSYSINDVTQTLGSSLTYKFEKNGKATVTLTIGGFPLSDIGTWELSVDKTELILKDSAGTVSTYEIVQLKNKDLKVRKTAPNYTEVWILTGL